MKKLYQQLKGFKGNGFLLTKYQLEDGTLLRGVALTLFHKPILSLTYANDKGWHDKDGNVYKFHLKDKRLFIRNVVIGFNILKKKSEDSPVTQGR
jgi:hypothetical protein